MTSLSYWEKRYLRIKAQELQNVADYEHNLKPRLSSLERELEKEANVWYSKYADNHDIDPETAKQLLKTVSSTDWTMTLEEFKRKAIKGGYTKELDSEYFKSRIARLQDLEEQLKQISSRFASDETDSLSNRLTDQFLETYMTTIFNTQVRQAKLTSNFARFNDDQIRYIVNQPWHKEDFSKRVWKNYREVIPKQLVDVMLRGTFMGYSPQRIARMLQQRFEGIRRDNIHRLVITEMGHVAEQATAKAYEESGIEKYEYMATLESHTCDDCAHLDGQIIEMSKKKEGFNYPLIHPRCRCTTVPYIDDLPDVKERWMRDPETGKGKIIDKMSYKDWKKKYVTREDDFNKKNLLPNLDNAIFPESKLTKYALDPTATKNGGADKARVFQAALGYNLDNYKDLISEVYEGIKRNPAIQQEDNGFGKRYKVDIPITGPNGNTRIVTTAWIEDDKNNQMKLTTIFVKSLKGDDKNG